jgi:prepilin-type N-terminal cleavage/methylation domain-containing protein
MRSSPKGQRGFSLIELLIVVTIISILVAIVIPYLTQAQQSARSASAISSLRIIVGGEASYRAINSAYGDMTALSSANLISDPGVRAGRKDDYDFVITVGDAVLGDATQYYKATATPTTSPARWLHYFVDASGVMRSEQGAPATINSTPLD